MSTSTFRFFAGGPDDVAGFTIDFRMASVATLALAEGEEMFRFEGDRGISGDTAFFLGDAAMVANVVCE